jgi:adenosylcobyric acid synthase
LRGTILVAGTSSGAGKSTVVTGLCRLLHRQGIDVAPFKAQNMSLNSFVTRQGAEIGRAQAAQAQAAGLEPEALMNPVLLKPGTDTTSQVIVLGHPVGEYAARDYWSQKQSLLDVVVDAHAQLRERFDVVIAEGAGSPAEINLRDRDIVNLGFAQAVGAPVIVVADIDRGGMFASLVGTLAVLTESDRALIKGFIVNRFRGDLALLQPGLDQLFEHTKRPVLGVLPHVRGLWLDTEDALDFAAYREPVTALGDDVLRVAVLWLPRASNLTDLDPLACEPGVIVRFVTEPQELADADLVVIPGTRATVDDLGWLRAREFDRALVARAAKGLPILGICGGYQMLGQSITDAVESKDGCVAGLGLLAVRTEFAPDKYLARPSVTLEDGTSVEGYEIRHGETTHIGRGESFFADVGARAGATAGTSWHGLFENDAFRRSYLSEVAERTGRAFTVAPDVSFAAVREERFDCLADLMEAHLDIGAIAGLLD